MLDLKGPEHRPARQALKTLESHAAFAAGQIPKIDFVPLKLRFREGQKDATLVQVVGRQLVSNYGAAGCPDGMQMRAAAVSRIHARRRLDMGLVVLQQRLVLEPSFNRPLGIDNLDFT